MKLDPTEYPTLRALFGGYLHQDFAEVHGDADGAVTAFREDASAEERRALDAEWRRFEETTRDWEWPDVLSALARLGAAWRPRDRAALTDAMTCRR